MLSKLFLLLWYLLLAACFQAEPPSTSVESYNNQTARPSADQPSLAGIADLYAKKTSQVQVEDSGVVVKVLSDDSNGSRHQRFLVKVATGQTLLFAHNIDLAARVENIKVGDLVEFRGEYIYNPKGGIVHWTHHDPQGKHHAGWIKLAGKTYD